MRVENMETSQFLMTYPYFIIQDIQVFEAVKMNTYKSSGLLEVPRGEEERGKSNNFKT
jgi:hypothetical protein